MKIVFTTGGTGGHVYPALALADKFKEEGYEILFIGSTQRMEKELVEKHGYEFIGYDIITIGSIKGLAKLVLSTFQIVKLFNKIKVDAVIGFGNYISLPACIAGFLNGKPIYVQEQNIEMGKANKLLKNIATKVYLAFKNDKYKSNKYVVSGNPLRKEFFENNVLEENAILVTGGSLGAKNINQEFINYYKKFLDKGIKVYWATGKNNFDEIKDKIEKNPNLIFEPYFDNMSEIMKKSKIVISRAGALTISEIIALNKPSILIPYDFVGQNENADYLVKNNASYKYSNDELEIAFKKALELIDNEKEIEEIKNNIRKLNVGNAVDIIYSDIDGFLKW